MMKNKIVNKIAITRIIIMILITCISGTSLGLVTYDKVADLNALKQIADGAKRHTEQVRQWKDQAMQWKQTLEHHTHQENTLKSQLVSFTGVRNIGDLEGQMKSLISEMDGIERNRSRFTEFLGASDPKINGEANQILNKYQMFDTCQKKGSSRLDNICKEEILNKAGTIETGEKIRMKMKYKMREVQKLSHKAAEASDLKESQDIANAISLKQAEINQLQHQWQTSVDEANLREKLIEQKKMQAFYEHEDNAPLPTFDINKFK